MSVSSIQSDSFCHFWTAITGVGGSEVPNPISHKNAHCCCTLLEPEEPGNKSANFWVGFQGSAKHLPEGVWRAGLVMIATNGSPSPVRKCSPAKLWPLPRRHRHGGPELGVHHVAVHHLRGLRVGEELAHHRPELIPGRRWGQVPGEGGQGIKMSVPKQNFAFACHKSHSQDPHIQSPTKLGGKASLHVTNIGGSGQARSRSLARMACFGSILFLRKDLVISEGTQIWPCQIWGSSWR